MKPHSRCGVTLKRGNDYRGGPAFRAGGRFGARLRKQQPCGRAGGAESRGLLPRCECPVEKDPPHQGSLLCWLPGRIWGRRGSWRALVWIMDGIWGFPTAVLQSSRPATHSLLCNAV